MTGPAAGAGLSLWLRNVALVPGGMMGSAKR